MLKMNEQSIMKNSDVNTLLEIIGETNSQTSETLKSLFQKIDSMSAALTSANAEIAKYNYAKDHPVAVRIENLCQKVSALIKSIVNGIRNAGAQGINAVLKGLKVKETLAAIRSDALKTCEFAEKDINAAQKRASAYHEIGKNIANIGRILTGKEQITEAKPNGKIAAALSTPFILDMKVAWKQAVMADKLIAKLESLDKSVQTRRDVKKSQKEDKKPSIIASLEQKTKEISAQSASVPPRQTTKVKTAEIA